MIVDRRELLGAAALGGLWLIDPAAAQDPRRDFVIDWQGGPETPAVAASLAAQIALVKSLKIKPEIAAFFADQIVTVDLAANTATRAGPRGVFFERKPMPRENPVLLHELLHRYHLLRLPGGFQNLQIRDFYTAAKAKGDFPPRAYLYKNPLEFFAMVTSVTLWGKAARPPYTRRTVETDLPAIYDWTVAQFGLTV